MTKEVAVIIEGFQQGQEEPVITKTSGIYHLHGDRHFIQYEEEGQEGEGSTKNLIKISATRIELAKRSNSFAQMNFDLEEKTETVYQTPYGSLFLEIKTNKIQIIETLDNLQIELEYTLYENGEKLSDNRISMMITARKLQ